MDDDDDVCARCGNIMQLRDGEEPTPICDHCAHACLEETCGLLTRVPDGLFEAVLRLSIIAYHGPQCPCSQVPVDSVRYDPKNCTCGLFRARGEVTKAIRKVREAIKKVG